MKNELRKHQEPLRLLVVAASSRIGSLNAKLAGLAAEETKIRSAVHALLRSYDKSAP